MGNNNNPRIIFRCDYCGDWSSDRPSHYARKTRHFCSTACYAGYRRDILPSVQQNSYAGGGMPVDERQKRVTARSDLNHAVKQGRVAKRACQDCGCPDSQAHHHDYDKPLCVEWLCIKCHFAKHKIVHQNPDLLK